MTVSRTRTQEMPGERDTFVCDCFMKKQERSKQKKQNSKGRDCLSQALDEKRKKFRTDFHFSFLLSHKSP